MRQAEAHIKSIAVCDPFSVYCRQSNNILTRYFLSELQMTGSISDVDYSHVWALIKAPDQRIYPVKLHSLIGLDGGEIIRLTPEKITLQSIVSPTNHTPVLKFLILIKGPLHETLKSMPVSASTLS